jgi:hypothetical protein
MDSIVVIGQEMVFLRSKLSGKMEYEEDSVSLCHEPALWTTEYARSNTNAGR